MKKVPKKTSETATKESDMELLTRLVVQGFSSIDKRFEQVDKQFELVNSKLFSINHQLKDHEQRLDRIERKQISFLTNLDEAVHRTEFKTLVKRVDVLESRG